MLGIRNLRQIATRAYSTGSRGSSGVNVSLASLVNTGNQPRADSNGDNPLTSTSGRLTPEESWTAHHHQRMRTLENEEPLSLYAGRTIAVGKFDKNSVTSQADRAWKRLNSTLARNDVKKELMLRDRYERPHQMRRRLRRERHRRRFAEMIRHKVSLVHSIRRRNEALSK